jgi:hypothetical protein
LPVLLGHRDKAVPFVMREDVPSAFHDPTRATPMEANVIVQDAKLALCISIRSRDRR